MLQRSIKLSLILLVAGCASSSLYNSWGKRLTEFPQEGRHAEDVSLLLGSPPYHCEPVPNPPLTIGVFLDPEEPVVLFAFPGGPSDEAGIRKGDRLVSVAGSPPQTTRDTISAIQSAVREGARLEIGTNRGSYQVVPRRLTEEQCYWELGAGQVGRAASSASINPYGGQAVGGSTSYQRFFRASCRIRGGYLATCQSNWQQ